MGQVIVSAEGEGIEPRTQESMDGLGFDVLDRRLI